MIHPKSFTMAIALILFSEWMVKAAVAEAGEPAASLNNRVVITFQEYNACSFPALPECVKLAKCYGRRLVMDMKACPEEIQWTDKSENMNSWSYKIFGTMPDTMSTMIRALNMIICFPQQVIWSLSRRIIQGKPTSKGMWRQMWTLSTMKMHYSTAVQCSSQTPKIIMMRITSIQAFQICTMAEIYCSGTSHLWQHLCYGSKDMMAMAA